MEERLSISGSFLLKRGLITDMKRPIICVLKSSLGERREGD